MCGSEIVIPEGNGADPSAQNIIPNKTYYKIFFIIFIFFDPLGGVASFLPSHTHDNMFYSSLGISKKHLIGHT